MLPAPGELVIERPVADVVGFVAGDRNEDSTGGAVDFLTEGDRRLASPQAPSDQFEMTV